MAKLKQLGRLYLLYARMDLRWFLQDTKMCLLVMASELIGSLAGFTGMLLLSVRFGGVGGFSTDEVLFLLALAMLGDGMLRFAFFGFNSGHIRRPLGRAHLDHMLNQPVPLWMQLLAESFMPVSGNSTLVCGMALTGYALSRLGLQLTAGWWLLLIGFLLVRVVLTISLSYIVGSRAVWQPVACEEISSVVIDLCESLCRYPLVGLPAPLMLLLETVLPIALLTYLPARVLLGKTGNVLSILWPFLAAMLFSLLATFTFRKGLKHYAKVGSHRYRSMGYRD